MAPGVLDGPALGDSRPPSRSGSRPGSPGISSPSHRTIPPAHLTIGDEIGKNPFRRVHRGRHKRRDVVVLRYAKGGPNNGRELQVLSQLTLLNPPHIPEILGVSVDGETTSIVQELSPFGSLRCVLQNERLATQLTPAHRVAGAAQLARAMDFLQSEHCVHADLKGSNVLVFRIEPEEPSRILLKITDFGLALMLDEGKDSIILKQPRAVRWCAPETINESKLSYRSDVWSLGATLWEFFSGGTDPWSRLQKRSDVSDHLREIGERYTSSGDMTSLDAEISSDFVRAPGCPAGAHATILECLRVDEMKRLTFMRVAERLEGSTDVESEEPSKEDNSGFGDSPSSAGKKSSQRLRGLSSQLSQDGSPRHLLSSNSLGLDEAEVQVEGFDLIREFLDGPMATELCDDNMIQSIWTELREAQVRENYLKDRIQGLSDAGNLVNGTGEAGGKPWEGTPQDYPVMSISARPPMLPWVLWTFDPSRRSLQSHEFYNEAEALENFTKVQAGGPCMLRDPSGAECAARNWVSSYFSIAPAGVLLPDIRTPSMASAWPVSMM